MFKPTKEIKKKISKPTLSGLTQKEIKKLAEIADCLKNSNIYINNDLLNGSFL